MNNFDDSLSSYVNYHRHDALEVGFNKARTQQAACFREINNKCNVLQDSITYLQKTIAHLQAKLSEYSENNQSVKLNELKEKQKQFIISQLQKKVKRLQTNQQSLQASVMQKQMQISELKDKYYELTTQNTQIKEQNIKKAKQIKQLIKTNSTLKLAQSFNQKKSALTSSPVHTPNISQLGMKKQQIFNRNQNYEELELKLKELENYFNGQVQHYKLKNGKLEKEIKRLNQELQKQSLNIKRIYQLQLRVKNLTSENQILEQSYTSQLTTMNENEVKFHKKINELKNQIHELKRAHRNEYKQYQKELKKFSSHVLGASDKATIFIGVEGIREQLQELGKQILKWHNKQIKSVGFEKDSIIEDLQINMEASKNKIFELHTTIQKMKVKKNEIIEKSPVLNGHSIANKSNSQNNLQSKQKQKQKQKINEKALEQKYEQKIKQITAEFDEKQKQINQMRRKYDEIGTEMGKKQLQLQTKITQKQMQLQYQEQNMNQFKSNSLETQKNRKNQAQKQIKKLKDRIKQVDSQRDQLKNKYKQCEQKLQSKQRLIKDMERKQKQINERIKKIEKRNEAKAEELKKIIETKDKNIEQLIAKNQTVTMELKLAKQRLRITQLNLNSFKNQSQYEKNDVQKQANERQARNQLFLQKQQLEADLIIKQQENQNLKEANEQKSEIIKKKQEKVMELNHQIYKIGNDLKLLRNQNQLLKQNSQKLRQSSQKLNSFAQLRQQYQKREKILKAQGEKIIIEMKGSKKQIQAQNKKLADQLNELKSQNSHIKTQINQYEQEKLKFNAQKFKDSERQRKMIKNYEQKISLLSSKLSQIQKDSDKKLNSMNSSPSRIKKASTMKKTNSTEYAQFGMMTEKLPKNDQGINTIDLFALQIQNNGQMNKILDLNDEVQEQVSRNSNLFMNLKGNAPNDDFFEICDQNQVVNFGESQLKLQVRELFTNLRIQIEKLFNQDQISFATTKLLPQGLQDDYYQLMGYIKQKIAQIKAQVQISFIMAEPGNEPEPQLDNSLQLPAFIERHASERVGGESLRKIIEQKEALINSLMNEKTSQENTINQLTVQKQEIQQQNQNRFMNQCNVYKKQIKQHKKTIDKFQMNLQSMKIVLRNILQAYSENQDMEDDFRESMNLYAKVSDLTQKERSRINYYIQRYLEIKGLDTAF